MKRKTHWFEGLMNLNNQLNFDLTAGFSNETQLSAIIEWYKTYISRDIIYSGTAEEQYYAYIKDIRQLLEQADNLTLFTMVERGYDQLLLSEPTSQEAINQKNMNGMTLLHLAAVQGYPFTTAALLSKEADPKQRNQQKQLPIHSACFIPLMMLRDSLHKKEIIINMLFQAAPETILIGDDQGNTAFHYMAKKGFNVLLEQHIKKNTRGIFLHNRFHRFPIHEAILGNQLETIQLLMSLKDVSTLTDTKKRAAIHYAACFGSTEILKVCCEHTDNLDVLDADGKTPIILAAKYKNVAALNVLMHQKVNIHLTDHDGKTAQDYCRNTDFERLLQGKITKTF